MKNAPLTEVICIESEAFKKIMDRLDDLENYFKHIAKQQPLADPILTNEDVCKLLKISKFKLAKFRNEGYIQFYKAGSRVYFRASDIDVFLKKYTLKAFRKPEGYF